MESVYVGPVIFAKPIPKKRDILQKVCACGNYNKKSNARWFADEKDAADKNEFCPKCGTKLETIKCDTREVIYSVMNECVKAGLSKLRKIFIWDLPNKFDSHEVFIFVEPYSGAQFLNKTIDCKKEVTKFKIKYEKELELMKKLFTDIKVKYMAAIVEEL